MKKVFPILLVSLALAACAAEPKTNIHQQLSGKSKQERVATLAAACEKEFSKGHVTTNYNVKYGKIRFRPHTKETKAVCGAMEQAANGSRVASADQLLSQCLNEQVIGGRINKSRNQKHIERVNNICRAFRAEM